MDAHKIMNSKNTSPPPDGEGTVVNISGDMDNVSAKSSSKYYIYQPRNNASALSWQLHDSSIDIVRKGAVKYVDHTV